MPETRDIRRTFVAIDDFGRELARILSRNPTPTQLEAAFMKHEDVINRVIASAPEATARRITIRRNIVRTATGESKRFSFIRTLYKRLIMVHGIKWMTAAMEEYKADLFREISRSMDFQQSVR